jgi:multidrug efflux pump subunit AcrA (membrane-fusion protein)
LVVNETTRTVPLLYEVANRDGRFRVGQNLTLQVETDRTIDAIAVPESALVEEDGQLIAFVQLSGETFEKRDVRTGIRDSGWVEVLAGLEADERVVTFGAYAIRLSSVSGVIPAHGHAH